MRVRAFINGFVTGILFCAWALALIFIHLCFAFVFGVIMYCLVKGGSGFWATAIEVIALSIISNAISDVCRVTASLYKPIIERMDDG